jgi:hypothetical protein
VAVKVDPRSFKGLSRFLAPSAGGPLADRALAERIISAEQLQEAVAEQDRTGRPLDEILVERGHLKAEEATRLRQPPLPPEVVEASADPRRHMGHYVLVTLVGSGGMAEVWKAWDRSLGRWVAVKYLRPDIGHPTQRIEREGRMAGQLSHPSIINIFERGQHEGRPYLVMPFVDGRPPRSPLPPREAARIGLEVARALAHAHRAGVIHRDVKPGNILIEAGGHVVLLDFGLAIPGDSGASRWAVSGTPEYASPEQIQGEVLDARTDVYSLGATLHHLLTGRPPFTGKDPEEIGRKVLAGGAPALRGVPRFLSLVVSRAMQVDRGRRTPSMETLAEELAAFVERSSKPFRVRPIRIALFLSALVLPWGATYVILRESNLRDDREAVIQSLREGERGLARAEQLAGDPEAGPREAVEAARRALPHFALARRWAGGRQPEASLGLGRCAELARDDRAAEEAYREALPDAAGRLGLVRVWLRRDLEGRREQDWRGQAQAEAELLRGPSAPVYAAVSKGDWTAALGAGERSAQSDRSDAFLRVVLGIAGAEAGRGAEALRWLDQALRLHSHDPLAWVHKGRIHAARGERAEALRALERAKLAAPSGWPLVQDLEARVAALKP